VSCSAADKGHYEVIRVLAAYGADLGKVNTNGNTSLHIAAMKGYGQICKFLAQRGDYYPIISLHNSYYTILEPVVQNSMFINLEIFLQESCLDQ
jgi:ankyrin repeat protein